MTYAPPAPRSPGAMLEARLMERVRGELGLCYSVTFRPRVTTEYDAAWGLVSGAPPSPSPLPQLWSR